MSHALLPLTTTDHFCRTTRLVAEENAPDADVDGGVGTLRTPSAHLLDGEPRLAASVEVNLVDLAGEGALPSVTDNPESDHDRSGQVRKEERLGSLSSVGIAANREDGLQVSVIATENRSKRRLTM